MALAESHCDEALEFGCCKDFIKLVIRIMSDENLKMPTNADEALQLYIDLKSFIAII